MPLSLARYCWRCSAISSRTCSRRWPVRPSGQGATRNRRANPPPAPPSSRAMQPLRPVARSRHGQARCPHHKGGDSRASAVPALPTPSTAKHPSRCPWTTASSCPPPSTATSFLKILLFGKPGQPPLWGLKCWPGGAKKPPLSDMVHFVLDKFKGKSAEFRP